MKLISLASLTICAIGTAVIQQAVALEAMTESELSATTGEGLGFALENFQLVSDGANLKVTGINSTDGQPIDINWTKLYVMGEGSEAGTVENGVDANIGSYLHPWVIRSVRGSRGLSEGEAGYNPDYMGFGEDIAVLEIATDFYNNPLQSTDSYGAFSYYQGCVWGTPGCDNSEQVGDAGVAVQNNNSVYDALLLESQQIRSTYSGNTLSNLENTRNERYENDLAAIVEDVDDAQSIVDSAIAAAEVAYGQMNQTERDQTEFRSVPPCQESRLDLDYCNGRERNYVDSLEDIADAQETLRRQKARLNDAESEIIPDVGVSYRQLLADIDRYKSLCGYSDNIGECENGLVVETREIAADTEQVSIALANGSARRSGLDIGSTFEFRIASVDETGLETSRDDFLNIDLKGVFFDGTSFKLWSRPDADGLAELNGELRLNLFVKEIDISACATCSSSDDIAANTLNLDNFFLSLRLGYGEVQPLKFSASGDGNFVATLDAPDHNNPYANPNGAKSAKEFYEDYYANAPKSFLYIGDVRVGSGPNASLGSTTIEGFRAQYLKVESRDL